MDTTLQQFKANRKGHEHTMNPLDKSLRNTLEKTVKDARKIAEDAAKATLEQLGVGEPAPFVHLTDSERDLRRRLRIHGRQLGDTLNGGKDQTMERLMEEVAYQHWHRMLFARFLAENNLLMYPDPDDPVAITLEECEDLAPDEGAVNGWELAARYAARMLPQIFRLDSPVFQLALPPEYQQKLEHLVAGLPLEVFIASDSLGWVYQFWQARKKEAINASEVKIGARELPAVTQLFTEPYMVSFLLDNSPGAWWAARRLTEADLQNASSEEELRRKAAIPGAPLNYLRFVKVKVEAASSRFHEIGHSEKVEAVEAASSRFHEIGYFHKDQDITNLSGNLPHWRQDAVTYFVTFRTADSLPQEKLKLWQTEKNEWLKQHPEPHDKETKRKFYEKFPERIQKWLDQGYGECILGKEECKAIVENALTHFDGDRYELDEYVVMPNHVHVIVTPKNGYALSGILHSWKSYTASKINKRIGKSGSFWQKESFDHIVRSPEQLERIRAYICNHSAYEGKRQDAASTLRWMPAGGWFDRWPENLKDIKTLDPCCGSGHFLVSVFLMLVPMRMALENLSARDAVDAVLQDNIHGLEIDQRCVELAAFALALSAWTYPGAGGYRVLPEMNVACSGLSVSVAKNAWKEIAQAMPDKSYLPIALNWMYEAFKDAPTLGSLLDPARAPVAGLVNWQEIGPTIKAALTQGQPDTIQEAGVVARGLAATTRLLTQKYHWIITNVPYLARGKQNETLQKFCATYYKEGKNDLATVFLDRCLELCVEEPSRLLGKAAGSRLELCVEEPSRLLGKAAGSRFHSGTVSVVLPQNWLFLTSYRKFREKLLKNDTWHLIARLGPGAFETISGEVVKAVLITLSRGNPSKAGSESVPDHQIRGLDVSELRTAEQKMLELSFTEIKSVGQVRQLENPDSRITLDYSEKNTLLEQFACGLQGVSTSDNPRFKFNFWEHPNIALGWQWFQGGADSTSTFGGYDSIVWLSKLVELYEATNDLVFENNEFLKRRTTSRESGVYLRGQAAWSMQGIAIRQISSLPASLTQATPFDTNIAVILSKQNGHLPAIWCFCSSPEYNEAVRRIDQKLNVTNATLVKVPFDLDHWTKVAAEKYPNGLPQPYTNDPTQWIFHGHPCGSVVWNEETKRLEVASTLRTDDTVLQVAVARLLGYRWPAELDPNMELADEQREWVNRCDSLLSHADEDGIVCIPPVRGEPLAADRLLNLLAAAYGDAWSNTILARLLKNADHAGKTLESWLRDRFFTQHCKLFKHRPFIWHIWDGLQDGFAALINYHKLDTKRLETLIYSYLGDWINRQKQDIIDGVDGARERLDAAEALKKKWN